jgi:hypothetical protein
VSITQRQTLDEHEQDPGRVTTAQEEPREILAEAGAFHRGASQGRGDARYGPISVLEHGVDRGVSNRLGRVVQAGDQSGRSTPLRVFTPC